MPEFCESYSFWKYGICSILTHEYLLKFREMCHIERVIKVTLFYCLKNIDSTDILHVTIDAATEWNRSISVFR